MGVEHYLVCHTCREYIDLHKAYMFDIILRNPRPKSAAHVTDNKFNLCELRGGYWETRGLWFLWQHRGCKTEMHYDSSDAWYDLKPHLKEVWPHSKDVKLRERENSPDETTNKGDK